MQITETSRRPLAVALTQAVLGIVAALLVVAFLTGTPVPFLSGDRSAFLVLAAVGFLMCALGMGHSLATYGWRDPINLIGTVLGVAILLLVLAVLVGVQVPLIAGDREAFIAVAVLGATKIALAGLRTVLPSGAAAVHAR